MFLENDPSAYEYLVGLGEKAEAYETIAKICLAIATLPLSSFRGAHFFSSDFKAICSGWGTRIRT